MNKKERELKIKKREYESFLEGLEDEQIDDEVNAEIEAFEEEIAALEDELKAASQQ
jgi:hypothetical protein